MLFALTHNDERKSLWKPQQTNRQRGREREALLQARHSVFFIYLSNICSFKALVALVLVALAVVHIRSAYGAEN